MSAESKDLHDLRQAEYARALSQCPVPVEVEPDVDEDACLHCGGSGECKGRFSGELITCPKCGGRGV